MSGATATPKAASEPGGRFRRLIDLARRDEGKVVGWLEDDVHHFGVTLIHDQEKVVDVAAATVRFPYTTCGSAIVPFRSIIGTPLTPRATDMGRVVEMQVQCTHLYDLAALLIGFAASGDAHKRFEAIIEDRPFIGINAARRRIMGPGEARLLLDDVEVLHWELDGQTVTGPGVWTDLPLMNGFRQRTEQLDVALAEQAFVLRRAVMVSNGRTAVRYPLPRDRGWPGVCHTFQPHVREYAERIDGLRMNFEESSAPMLAHVDKTPSAASD